MEHTRFTIDPDIARAQLPPGELYGDPQWHRAVLDRVFGRSWQLLHAVHEATAECNAVPVELGGEPMVMTHGDAGWNLLSNVCTHRGAIVASEPCRVRNLRCPYHGRRWRLDGALASAPGFEGAVDFPAERDNLARGSVATLGPWVFGSRYAHSTPPAWLRWMQERFHWVAWDRMAHDPSMDRSYDLDVNWALYVDNYLEGFHVPFVHPGLAKVLDPDDYRQELHPGGTLQIGIAREGEDHFDLPSDSVDASARVAGFYCWLFPNTMVNLYPWGASLNKVCPVGPQRTRIEYRRWIVDPSRLGQGAGGDLETVELEDQAVVRLAQRGVRSAMYPGGRYSPKHEVGLHHFHRLLSDLLGRDA